MSESTRNGRKNAKPPTAANEAKEAEPAAIVKAPPAALARTEEQWRAWTDALVDHTNLLVRKAGLEKEGAADTLFRETFGQDWQRALDPDGDPTEEYLRLSAREGKSLRLDSGERARDYVRIGALNHHRRDARWRGLDWTFKLELLPLLGPKTQVVDEQLVRVVTLERFNEGLEFAIGPNVGTAHLRAYVQEQTPPSTLGRPRGESLTLPRAGRFTKTGVMLGDAQQRARFVERIQALPAKDRRALLKDLRETHENLAKLLGEFDTP